MGRLRELLDLEPDPAGHVEDPRLGAVLVTSGTPYRVQAAGLELVMDTQRKRVRVGHREGRLRPSRAVGRRAADDVRVDWDGHDVHLKQRGRKRAEIRLDGRCVARLQQRVRARGRFDPWRERYDIFWQQDVSPEVALIAHALASRYGVGAHGALVRSLDLVSGLG